MSLLLSLRVWHEASAAETEALKTTAAPKTGRPKLKNLVFGNARGYLGASAGAAPAAGASAGAAIFFILWAECFFLPWCFAFIGFSGAMPPPALVAAGAAGAAWSV